MSNKEMVARFTAHLLRLTLAGEINWEVHDPADERQVLSPEAEGFATSSVYYTTVDDIRVRLYRRKRKAAATVSGFFKSPGVQWTVECVLEFVNPDGFSDAEHDDLPGLPHLFDVVRRKASGLDKRLTAFMEKEAKQHAERHHG